MESKYKPFHLKHSQFKNIFYDSDFEEIRRSIKSINDVLKTMELRQVRRDTLQVARSIFDYESQKDYYLSYPHLYYDFRFGDSRICVGCKNYHGQKEYFVNCAGYNPSARFNSYIGHFGYGHSDTLEGVLTLFSDIVRDFILTKLEALF